VARRARERSDRGRARSQSSLASRITLDRYGHLFPGSEEQAARLLDAYLKGAHERARRAEIAPCGKSAGNNTPEKGGSERRKAVSSAANRKPPRTANAPKSPANQRVE
jgi:hypothetical protein